MRRVIYCCAVLLATTLAPAMVLAGNQEVAEGIASALQETNITEGCDIGLKYQNETVTLTGVVDDASKISAIQSMVEKVDGVGRVVNQLEVEKAAISDNAVQQTAGIQRSVMRRSELQGISNEQIISDEVVAVDGVAVGDGVVDTNVPSAVAPETEGMSVLASAPGNQVRIQGSKPLPLRQASYGTTTTGESVLVNPPTEGTPYNMGTPGTPMAVNSQAYGMPANGGSNMRYDHAYMPNKAWPSYASYPNTAAVQYPKRHTANAWPYIGPYYPYPQVPDGWRKVTLEWHDGYWHVDFDDGTTHGPFNGLFRRKP